MGGDDVKGDMNLVWRGFLNVFVPVPWNHKK